MDVDGGWDEDPPEDDRSSGNDAGDAMEVDAEVVREALRTLYADETLAPEAMRAAKEARFAAMREDYAALKASWDGYAGYDGWFARELNNARLVAVSTYRRYVPAFAALYVEAGEDIERFHALVAEVGALPPEERRARLDALLDASGREA